MHELLRVALVVGALALGGPVLAGCGSGGGGAHQDATAQPDAGGGDSLPAHQDGGGDAAGGDGGSGDAAGGDAAGGDGGVLTQSPQFLSETSGGARLQSAGYRMELFVAPVRPVGAAQSTNYKMTLGPAALRNAR